MFPDDIRAIFQWLDSAEGLQKVSETKRLVVKALLSTGFMLMTRSVCGSVINHLHRIRLTHAHRINEVMDMRFDAVHKGFEDNISVLTFDLTFRKTNDDPSQGIHSF